MTDIVGIFHKFTKFKNRMTFEKKCGMICLEKKQKKIKFIVQVHISSVRYHDKLLEKQL